MCTVTYLPLPTKGFLLTHSRDEKAIRPAAFPPKAFRIGERNVTYPQDPQGLGTWIAASAQTAICLLNGAFTPHRPRPPYNHSRGLVIPQFFAYPSLEAFVSDYSFSGIEPFTLLIREDQRLVELRWNGVELFIQEKDPEQPYIWSSVTLYSSAVIEKREGWFREWLQQHPQPTIDAIRQFHQLAGDGDPTHSLRMNRQNALLTISLTSIVREEKGIELIYEDFTQSTYSQLTIPSPYAIA
jgi:hypothetical protein